MNIEQLFRNLDNPVDLPGPVVLGVIVLGAYLFLKFWTDANKVKRDYRHGGKMNDTQFSGLVFGNSCLMVLFCVGLLVALLIMGGK